MFSGIFVLKFLFFILSLLFASVGLVLKLVITIVFGALLLPLVGVLFSGGFIVFLFLFMGLGALIGEKKRI